MHCDFVVKHDWETETEQDLVNKIWHSIFIGRIKSNKPCTIGVFGGSGEGKSISAGIKLQETLLKLQGVNDISPYFEGMNVYTPLEYPSKINAILFDSFFKDINVFTIHEARQLVKSHTWQSFLTQSVADINATSRQVKRLITIFISQSMSDIARDVRKTLDYMIVMKRPRGKRPRMKIKVLWLDERDPEKPQLRTRNLSGLIIDKYGRYMQFSPTFFEISPPSKNLIEIFEEQDRKAKGDIIKKKMDKMIQLVQKELGVSDDRVSMLVDYYTKDFSTLALIGKKNKNGWKVSASMQKVLNLSDDDFKIFEKRINEKVENKPKEAIKDLDQELKEELV